MKDINDVINAFKQHGMKVPNTKIQFNVPNAKQQVEKYLSMFVKDYKWLKEYDLICEWLTDNQGKGLMLFGDCGRGKTIMTQWIIPAILLESCRTVLKVYSVNELSTNIETITASKLFGIDDIGTEEMSVEYGNKRMYFADIMDLVEKQNKLIVITSNLNGVELKQKYGERILDRIVSTTTRIEFNGVSLRG